MAISIMPGYDHTKTELWFLNKGTVQKIEKMQQKVMKAKNDPF
jgi:hypothetical protein